ncbi:hypothetical protein OH77DRAFT_1162459 [Trametes cingulata]|nr:hypothetical protein OH77DRAFT_1162459 [Trametes cingulata]
MDQLGHTPFKNGRMAYDAAKQSFTLRSLLLPDWLNKACSSLTAGRPQVLNSRRWHACLTEPCTLSSRPSYTPRTRRVFSLEHHPCIWPWLARVPRNSAAGPQGLGCLDGCTPPSTFPKPVQERRDVSSSCLSCPEWWNGISGPRCNTGLSWSRQDKTGRSTCPSRPIRMSCVSPYNCPHERLVGQRWCTSERTRSGQEPEYKMRG